ncbi:hypothetical protein PHMEG_00015423 [Phytophthora megakarya]|uniref:Uncharacterized protein n=1 Tax=Phytophthora megakarya TaxID=4795 RepID=A0A225W2C5_9STRA|nr:hypothetical protein PHMEG_00015423 [Phytophthora megakarya]
MTRNPREFHRRAAETGDNDLDLPSIDCEIVLSKEEFDMLHAFHRFVPLPALSSRILRVYCEDDLQVPEASNDDNEDNDNSSNKTSTTEQSRQSSINSTSTRSILRHPCRPSSLKKKPRIQINLTSQTARTQQPRSRPNSSGSPDSERPKSQA